MKVLAVIVFVLMAVSAAALSSPLEKYKKNKEKEYYHDGDNGGEYYHDGSKDGGAKGPGPLQKKPYYGEGQPNKDPYYVGPYESGFYDSRHRRRDLGSCSENRQLLSEILYRLGRLDSRIDQLSEKRDNPRRRDRYDFLW